MMGLDSGVLPGVLVCEPLESGGINEYPMAVFDDGLGRYRHTQLGACSYRELEGLLWAALESERKAFVILSHNFELLNQAKDRPDPVVVARFKKLCRFFDRNRDSFRARGFSGLEPKLAQRQPPPLKSSAWKTAVRMAEQVYRKRYA
jgi:hypothetical protein